MTVVQTDYSSAAPSIDANSGSIAFFNTQYTYKQSLTASLASQPFIANAANYVKNILIPYHLNYLKGTLETTTTVFSLSTLTFLGFAANNPQSPFPDMNSYTLGNIISGWSFTATVSTVTNPSSDILFQDWHYNGIPPLSYLSAGPGSTFDGVNTISSVNLTSLTQDNDKITFLAHYINADPRLGQTVANYVGPGLKYEAASIRTTIQNLNNQNVFYAAKMSVLSGLS